MSDSATTDPSAWDQILATYASLDPARQERLLEYSAKLTIEQAYEMTGNIGPVVQTMRECLGATMAELSLAAGIRRPSIESIERGRETTVAERQDIAAGVAWLAITRNRVTANAAVMATRPLTAATPWIRQA